MFLGDGSKHTGVHYAAQLAPLCESGAEVGGAEDTARGVEEDGWV